MAIYCQRIGISGAPNQLYNGVTCMLANLALQRTTSTQLFDSRDEQLEPLTTSFARRLYQLQRVQQHLRHIVGQFLVEGLGISWVHWEQWFHACLADADVAINAMIWSSPMDTLIWLLTSLGLLNDNPKRFVIDHGVSFLNIS